MRCRSDVWDWSISKADAGPERRTGIGYMKRHSGGSEWSIAFCFCRFTSNGRALAAAPAEKARVERAGASAVVVDANRVKFDGHQRRLLSPLGAGLEGAR